MVSVNIEISISVDKDLFEEVVLSEFPKSSCKLDYLYSDNLHHKYTFKCDNINYLVDIGKVIASFEALADTHEVGYCIVTNKGSVIAPYIVDLQGSTNHLDQYDKYLATLKIDRTRAQYCTEKLCVAGFANIQPYKQFKYISRGEKDFTHISNSLNQFK